MPTISNKIYNFLGTIGVSPTTISIQSTYGLSNGDVVEILSSLKYQGTYSISNITASTFDINVIFDGNESGAAWQITRARPVLVNPEGETIDTLRQGVNQISSDIGNKFNLNPFITNKNNLVEAINSIQSVIEQEQLNNLIRAIATN